MLLGQFQVADDPSMGSLLYAAVVSQPTAELSDDGWLDRLEAITLIESRLQGLKAEAIAGFEGAMHGVSADLGHRHPELGDRDATPGERRWVAGDLRSVGDEIGLILGIHRGAATSRIHSSCELVHNFPSTLQALIEGDLTERAAFGIVSELSPINEPDERRAAEADVLGWARKHPLHGIRKAAQREAARRCPSGVDKAHKKAREDRSVRMVPNEFGTADLIHNQDAVDAAAVMTSLSRAATRLRRQGDPRTFDQLRADIALGRLLPRTKRPDNSDTPSPVSDAETESPADSEAPQDTVGAETTVVIHATAAELRALLEDHPSTGGEAQDLGPIPQNSLRKHLTKTLARALLPELSTEDTAAAPGRVTLKPTRLAKAAIRLRIIDQPPQSNPDSYVPSGALATHVRWRDQRCRFPGCNRPAEFTDLDHRTTYTEGGRTTAPNLHCLCRHHHRLKHEGNWRTTRNPDGSHTWTSPTGRQYREEPADSWIRGSP